MPLPTSSRLLAVMLTGSGLLHLARPQVFEDIVPKVLPHKRELVYASGAVELACAALMVVPRTRRLGGLLSAGLLVAVFPANVQMAADVVTSPKASPAFKAGTIARLPLQWPLIRAALRAAAR